MDPKCECGSPKSAHNILSPAPGPRGSVRNGPHLRPNGQVFCHMYREVASGRGWM